MRDSTIHSMHEANARRSALLFQQWEFLHTRMLAFEEVTKRCSLLDRVMFFFVPALLLKAVDAVQTMKLRESHEKMQEVAAKPKLTVVKGGL